MITAGDIKELTGFCNTVEELGDVGVNLNGKVGVVRINRSAFLQILFPTNDNLGYGFTLVEAIDNKAITSFVGQMSKMVAIPDCETLDLLIAPYGAIFTSPELGDYQIRNVEVLRIFDPSVFSPKKQNTNEGNDFVGIQKVDTDLKPVNPLTTTLIMNTQNLESDNLNVNTSDASEATNYSSGVNSNLIALLFKKYRQSIVTGAPKNQMEKTSLGLAKNLVTLQSEGKITEDVSLAMLRLFYTNCSHLESVPSIEILKDELNSAKNSNRLLKEIPDEKIDSTNATAILGELYRGRVKWNEMSKTIELDGKKFEDGNQFYLQLGREHGLKASRELAKDTLVVVARDNSYNPIHDYLAGVTKQYQDYNDQELAITNLNALLEGFGITDAWERRAAIKCFLSAVVRTYEPGSKCDLMLILKGAQGYGKSTLINTLAGVGYVDLSEDPTKKDGVLEMHSGWIVELSEVEKFTRTREAFTTKAIITRQVDKLRPPYGAEHKDFKRNFIFVGTTNEDDLFLDPTGNRRYVVANVTKKVDFKDIADNRDLFWACLTHLYNLGTEWWLSDKDFAEQSERNKSAVVTDSRIEIVEEYIQNKNQIMVLDVVQMALQIKPSDPGFKRAEMDVAKMLKQLGYSKVRQSERGKKVTMWVNLDQDETSETPAPQRVDNGEIPF